MSCQLCGITHAPEACTECALKKQKEFAAYVNSYEYGMQAAENGDVGQAFNEPIAIPYGTPTNDNLYFSEPLTQCQAWLQATKSPLPTSFNVTVTFNDFPNNVYTRVTKNFTASLDQWVSVTFPSGKVWQFIVRKKATGTDGTGWFTQYSFLLYYKNTSTNAEEWISVDDFTVSPGSWIDYGPQPAGCTTSPTSTTGTTGTTTNTTSSNLSYYTKSEIDGLLYGIYQTDIQQNQKLVPLSNIASDWNNVVLPQFTAQSQTNAAFDAAISALDARVTNTETKLKGAADVVFDPTTGLAAVNKGLMSAYTTDQTLSARIENAQKNIADLAEAVNVHLENPPATGGGGIGDILGGIFGGLATGGALGGLGIIIIIALLFMAVRKK